MIHGEAVLTFESGKKFLGPVDPQLVMEEVLDRAAQVLPYDDEFNRAPDALDTKTIESGREEFRTFVPGTLQKKWFDIL